MVITRRSAAAAGQSPAVQDESLSLPKTGSRVRSRSPARRANPSPSTPVETVQARKTEEKVEEIVAKKDLPAPPAVASVRSPVHPSSSSGFRSPVHPSSSSGYGKTTCMIATLLTLAALGSVGLTGIMVGRSGADFERGQAEQALRLAQSKVVDLEKEIAQARLDSNTTQSRMSQLEADLALTKTQHQTLQTQCMTELRNCTESRRESEDVRFQLEGALGCAADYPKLCRMDATARKTEMTACHKRFMDNLPTHQKQGGRKGR